MRFVKNDDFAASGGRRVANHFAKFADLIDAAIRSSVNFDDVQRSAGRDLFAGVAYTARFGSGPVHAVECLCENASRCSFPHTARAGKNVCVRYAIIADGILKRFRDVSLSDQMLKRLRSTV